MSAHERQALLSLQEILQARGKDLTPEGKRALMQADEADFDKLVEFIGEDDE